MPIRTRFSFTSLALVALSASLLVACGDSSDTGGSGGSSASGTTTSVGGGSATATTTASTGDATSSTSTGPGPECDGPGFKGEATPQVVNSLDVTLVDQNGAPAANLPVQLCGLDICLFGDTDANGHVFISANNKTLDTPAFKSGEGLAFGRFANLLPNTPDIVLGTVTAAKLPATGEAMTPGGSVTSGEVTLTFAADAFIEVDELTFGEPADQVFRSATIPIGMAPPAVDATLGFELLYAASPHETLFCPPAKLTVKNSEGWAAGTVVEVFLHGVSISEEYAPYGEWAKVAEGKVSDDGATISTNDGEGLPELSAIAIRQK